MADFGRCKGKVLVLPSGLTVVPFHHAGSGYDCIIVVHTILGEDDGLNYIGRTQWISRELIEKAEVIPSTSLLGLAAAYGSTH